MDEVFNGNTFHDENELFYEDDRKNGRSIFHSLFIGMWENLMYGLIISLAIYGNCWKAHLFKSLGLSFLAYEDSWEMMASIYLILL